MYKRYRIDERKLRQRMEKLGFRSLAAVLRKAGLHRNSIADYLSGRKSVFSSVTDRLCATLELDPWEIVAANIPAVKPDGVETALKRVLAQAASEVLKEKSASLAFILIGSRAKGTSSKHSDWDVAISAGADALSTEEYLALKSAIEDAVDDFPVSVDLVNFDAAPAWFLANIVYAPRLLVGNEFTFARAMGVISGSKKIRQNLEGTQQSTTGA